MKIPVAPLLAALAASPLFAAHYDAKSAVSKEPRLCSVQDLRYPVWSSGHYLACFSQRFRTVENWGGYFYGGIVGHADRGETLIQICSWQMSGKNAPAAGIDFIHAGPHMSWAKTTWEGSAGGIKGLWPADALKNNVWYRFVSRTWAGPGENPDHSFIGVWMKNTATGEWHHLATTRYPGVIRDIDDHHGFQENFAGERADPVATVDVRNLYSLRNGAWVSDDRVQLRAQNRESVSITAPEANAMRLRTYWNYTRRTSAEAAADKTFDPKKIDAVLKQPATPTFFDPVSVAGLSAERLGANLAVKWSVPAKSSPQLAALLEIFDNANLAGAPVKTVRIDNPDTRDALVDIGGAKHAFVRLTLTDIFDRQAAPVSCAARVSAPLPSSASSASLPAGTGLRYDYYEAPAGTVWKALPDFSKLTPVASGNVAIPGISPRRRRENYAFRFTGELVLPDAGVAPLSRFTLVSASAARLVVDGRTVIDHDGYHSIGPASGSVALAPGRHKIEILYCQGPRQSQQADDFLRLRRDDGRGVSDVPASAFAGGGPEAAAPVVVDAASASAGFATKPPASGPRPASIRYYMTNPGFDYFGGQGVFGAPYFLGETNDPEGRATVPVWGPGEKSVFARLVYADGRSVDTAPVSFTTAKPDLGPWTLTELEHHQYPVAAEAKDGRVALVGESMSLLTKPMTGDGEIVARLADITPDVPGPDGTRIDAGVWQAGIILRHDLRPSPGEPLGGNTDYAALLGKANGDICFIDSLMKNGAGNQPSRNQGKANRWFRIVRKGATFVSSVSPDGQAWKEVKTVELPRMPETLQAGFFLYALPSSHLTLHRAAFDHVAVTPAK